MKLPFVSRKKYETARNNLKVESEARQKIRKEFVKYQLEVKEKDDKRNLAYQQMEDNCKQLCNRLEYMEEKEKDYKKEIKRLRQLCTRHNIEYKKEEK